MVRIVEIIGTTMMIIVESIDTVIDCGDADGIEDANNLETLMKTRTKRTRFLMTL